MATHEDILTPQALFERVQQRTALHALVGDFSWVLALRFSHVVWDKLPAFFPLYADALMTNGPRPAFWDMQEIAREVPGGYDVYEAARDALSATIPQAAVVS